MAWQREGEGREEEKMREGEKKGGEEREREMRIQCSAFRSNKRKERATTETIRTMR